MSNDTASTLPKNIGVNSSSSGSTSNIATNAVSYNQSYCQQCHQHHQQQLQPHHKQQRCRRQSHAPTLPSPSSTATGVTTLCISGGGGSVKMRWTHFILFLILCSNLLKISVGKQRFCGKSLNDAMDLLCVHGYNLKLTAAATSSLTSSSVPASIAQKRFMPFIMQQTKYFPDNSQMKNVLFDVVDESSSDRENVMPLTYSSYVLTPFLSKRYNNIMAKTRRRFRRHHLYGGIYDECCSQPCTYSELSAYCRPA